MGNLLYKPAIKRNKSRPNRSGSCLYEGEIVGVLSTIYDVILIGNCVHSVFEI